jgi:hypothetical protein
MATHYCIGNPCWLCYPEYAPKQQEYYKPLPMNLVFPEKIFPLWAEERIIPAVGISGIAKRLITEIFGQGLDEDIHLWIMANMNLSVEDIKNERSHALEGSLEAKLLDILIEDLTYEEPK